ncbi:MAG: hypothetical protein K8I82_26475 [Anaerolineae bacterium]|nr:hypothetical protein [Anaerolineae bacterium]
MILEKLLALDEPSLIYKTRVYLHDEKLSPSEQQKIQTSPRVQKLLSERDTDGKLPHHPYQKWRGAHWVLVMLAELEYPVGESSLIPLREQVYDYLFSKDHVQSINRKTINGRVRMCASIEANAVYALLKLGLADDRTDELAHRLLDWQWPDGGWNCDKNPETVVASFHETLTPLRALAHYSQTHPEIQEAVQRAADVFLKRRLFRRLTDGSIIQPEFLLLHYPCYWHYDILFALKVLAEAGLIRDPRAEEALELVKSKRLSDGGFPAEKKFYTVSNRPVSGRSLVDWSGVSQKKMNPFVTFDALYVLKKAGIGNDF